MNNPVHSFLDLCHNNVIAGRNYHRTLKIERYKKWLNQEGLASKRSSNLFFLYLKQYERINPISTNWNGDQI